MHSVRRPLFRNHSNCCPDNVSLLSSLNSRPLSLTSILKRNVENIFGTLLRQIW